MPFKSCVSSLNTMSACFGGERPEDNLLYCALVWFSENILKSWQDYLCLALTLPHAEHCFVETSAKLMWWGQGNFLGSQLVVEKVLVLLICHNVSSYNNSNIRVSPLLNKTPLNKQGCIIQIKNVAHVVLYLCFS